MLAFAFGMSGFQYAYVADLPAGLVRFIGVAEVAAALGLLLPALTRIRPRLVVAVMGLAVGFHLARGEAPLVVPNLVRGALAGLIAWGRAKKAPLAPKHATAS